MKLTTKLVLFTSLLIIFSVRTEAQSRHICYIADEDAEPRERFVDFEKTVIDIRLFPEEKRVSGIVTHTFLPLRNNLKELYLDGPGIRIKKAALLNSGTGVAQIDTSSKEGVRAVFDGVLTKNKKYTLEIEYECHPKKGLYFTGWNNESRKQIWTQGQGVDNRHWFPHFDDLSEKVLTETIVEFPKGYPLISNGNLVKKEDKDSTTIWHYALSKPHASYLVMLAGGDFKADTLMYKNTPVQLWYHPEDEDKVKTSYDKTLEMFAFLEDYIGVEYPWENYAMIPVRDFLYGGMENTTATIFAESFMTDSLQFPDYNFVYVNAHELAHQWFGNYVTAHSVNAHWVHESFATFYHTVWLGEYFGEERFVKELENYREAAFRESESNLYPITHSKAGSVRHYFKGAAILSMLRDELGEEHFRESIKNFLRQYAHGGVRTPDLAKIIYETTGIPVDWFWDQWILRGGEPHVHASLEKIDGKTAVILEQLQPDSVGVFKLPLTVRVKSDGIIINQRIVFNTRKDTVFFDFKFRKTAYFNVDPGKRMLMKYTSETDDQMNLELFQNATSFIDRQMAVKQLDPTRKKVKKAFEASWQNEKSSYVKGEIAARCNEFEVIHDYIFENITELDAEVQKRFLGNLKVVPVEHKNVLYELLTNGKSYTIRTRALNKLIQHFPDEHDSILSIAADLPTDNRYDFRINTLLLTVIYGNGDSKKHIDELIGYTGSHYDYTVRMNAFEYLAAINLVTPATLKNAAEARSSFNRRLRNSVKTYLNQLKNPDEVIAQIESATNLTDDEKELLSGLMK